MKRNAWWDNKEGHRRAYYLGVQRRKERQVQAEQSRVLGLPIVVSPNDVDYRLALAAHSGSSWVPEERAHQEQQGYVDHMSALYKELAPLATTSEKQGLLKKGLEEYKRGYLKRLSARLSAQSRVLSPMITGPSKFPTARNQKRLATEQKRTEELIAWSEKEWGKLKRELADRGPVRTEDPDAVQKLRKKLESLEKKQVFMKEANRIVKKKGLSDREKIGILAQMPPLNAQLAEELLKPDFAGRVGFPDYALTNNNVEIRRLKARIEEVGRKKEQKSRVYTFNGGVVVDNAEANRVQVVFKGKPEQDIREKLKKAGFRWAPSAGAWQAYRGENASYYVEQITGVKMNQNPKLKVNYWPDNHDGHSRAAKLGWEHRKGRTRAHAQTRVYVPLTPSQAQYLLYLRDQVSEGEPGRRIPRESGEWIGYGSSYPDWMRGQGWTKEEVLRVFSILERGTGFRAGSRRQLNIADTIKGELARLVRRGVHESRRGRRSGSGGKRTGKRVGMGARGYRGRQAVETVERMEVEEEEGQYPDWVMENAPRFYSLQDLSEWINARVRVHGGKNKYYSSEEYWKLYPEIKKQWGRQRAGSEDARERK